MSNEAEFTGDETALYRLYDAGDVLLYVGITSSLKVRMTQHVVDKPWWGDVARKTVRWYPVRKEAATAEAAAIKAEKPKYNIAHGRRRVLSPADVVNGVGNDGYIDKDEFIVMADARRFQAVVDLPDGLGGMLARMCIQAIAEGNGYLPGDPEILLPHECSDFVSLAGRSNIMRSYRYKLFQKWAAESLSA